MSMQQHFLRCFETGRMVTFPSSVRKKDLKMLELTRSTFGIVRTARLLLSTTDLSERICTSPAMHVYVSAAYGATYPEMSIWRNERSRKLRFVNFWISFRGTFHRECMAFLQT